MEARIAANETFVAAQPAIDTAQNNRIKALEDATAEGGAVAESIKAAKDAADAAQDDVDAIKKRLDDEGGLVDRLEAVEASIGKDGALEARVAAVETKIGDENSGLIKDVADNAGNIATNAAAIEAINNVDTGILAQAKADATTKANDAKDAAIAKAEELDTALEISLQGYADQAQADAEKEAARLDGILKTDLESYADQAEADAKAYTDNALTWGSF